MTSLNFDMDALRALVVGVELGGFSHAAARLNRSPSAVSMQLRKLETQAGQQLLVRNGRGLKLTEAGDVLLQYARRLLALNDEMGVAVGAIARGGTVRVGMPQDLTDALLPTLLTRFAKARPSTHVEVRAGRNYTLMEDLATGKLDLALIFTAAGKHAESRIATLPTAWIARARRSTAKSCKPIGADGAVPLIVFDGPCLFRDMGIEALARAGIPWRLAMTTPSLAGVCCGVRAGLGVTVRTALGISKGVQKGLAVVPPEAGLPPLAPIDIVLRCPQDTSPAVQIFRDLLIEILRRECLMTPRARVDTGARMDSRPTRS
jgi:DNA-binding transcriptional LysR family regulator